MKRIFSVLSAALLLLALGPGAAFSSEMKVIDESTNASEVEKIFSDTQANVLTDQPAKTGKEWKNVGPTKPGAAQTSEINPQPEPPRAKIAIYFETNSGKITDERSFKVLNTLAEAFARPGFKGAVFVVEGHTDAKGTVEYNLRLSQRRAQAVARYLSDKAGPGGPELQVRGFGPEKPVADNKTEKGRALNRRVELVRIK